nr:hypothetical protein [Desulfobacterales bacterium]
HALDAAMLRQERFDCVIPVGGLDDQSRCQIFEHFLVDTKRSCIDVNRIINLLFRTDPILGPYKRGESALKVDAKNATMTAHG